SSNRRTASERSTAMVSSRKTTTMMTRGNMPYASGRVIHDADAHIMETPGFLDEHLEGKYRGRVGDSVLFPRRDGFHSNLAKAQSTADVDESQIMLRKNWDALG